MRKFCDWIPPTYQKPADIKIMKEEQEEEDEYRREFEDGCKAMWKLGDPLSKTNNEQSLHDARN